MHLVPVQSGEPCPRCTGAYKVLKSIPVLSSRIQYLGCGKCGYRPPNNKRVKHRIPNDHSQGDIRH
jgi:hypothetical protein